MAKVMKRRENDALQKLCQILVAVSELCQSKIPNHRL